MEEKEIEKIIIEYGKDIYSFCFFISRDKDLADELYQDTFLTAIYKRKNLNKEQNIKSYLMGVAVNLWKNHRKKENRRSSIAPQTYIEDDDVSINIPFVDISDEVAKKEEIRYLCKSVDNLPDKLKMVIILYYAGEMSTKEIGKSLGIPKGTVLSRLHKAREILRKEMEKYGY